MDKVRIASALDAVKTARNILTDDQALECPNIYKEWKGNGKEYVAGGRVLFQGELYKILQSHTSQPGWTPAAAPSLFAKILPGQDGTAVGEWQQPGSENGYKKGDRVTHNGKTWESIVEDAENGKGRNTWEPGVFGWVEVNE